ncbi:phosphotyrosine protein phosphatase [Cantharellus anzutake]|uniref:phosphotyrosine protein phosphatase n=1 Tax=Cantharellus anzutake TaxID=1750568 RepID=UPI001907E2F2|nr:phosphotyrosine protein phosphatase [Cantharellus anzutake]XP_038917667.1 phosphotyrosine protein phosphatase [Cantharellus anzutake]KAF8311425.1 phosphotyrosine protein phosphatase [Cantharellus anzutake]KAF8333925.1 phosphotyrosine protein phosphatase [Cantharellus anzutake]
MAGSERPLHVLIVCLGNICRSPMGHAVMEHEAKKKGLNLVVDSAGTAAYHEGEEPDERTVATCKKHGVPIDHLARAVVQNDFKTFDYILASDTQNLENLRRVAPKGSKAKIALFGSFDDNKPIQDPYYGGMRGFEKTYEQCVQYSHAFFDYVSANGSPTASL